MNRIKSRFLIHDQFPCSNFQPDVYTTSFQKKGLYQHFKQPSHLVKWVLLFICPCPSQEPNTPVLSEIVYSNIGRKLTRHHFPSSLKSSVTHKPRKNGLHPPFKQIPTHRSVISKRFLVVKYQNHDFSTYRKIQSNVRFLCPEIFNKYCLWSLWILYFRELKSCSRFYYGVAFLKSETHKILS